MPHPSPFAGRTLLALVAALAFAGCAFALATEHFGREPIVAQQWSFNPKVVEVANLPSRHYWYEVNGDPTFYFRGNTDALNTALQRFAAVDEPGQEIVLMPGPPQVRSLTGEQAVEADWMLRAPAGLYAARMMNEQGTKVLTRHPTLTAYVTDTTPPAADRGKVAGWIADLDRGELTVRDRATQELEKLGHAAGPALRQALAERPTAEKKARIDRLLGQLKGVSLEGIVLPAGIPVVGVDALLDRYRAGLKNPNPDIRGMAAGALGALWLYADDVVPTLTELLRPDQHEYVRRSAAGVLSRIGRPALAALPVLRAGKNDPDVNIRNAFNYTIEKLEEAKEGPALPADTDAKRVLREKIGQFVGKLTKPAGP
jgi:hypothetical protein